MKQSEQRDAKWAVRFPNVVAVIGALGVAVAVWLLGPENERLSRVLFAAALVLISAGSLESALLSVGPKRFTDPNRWTLASLHMAYLSAIMLIVRADFDESDLADLIGALVGGAIFGGLMAFVFAVQPPEGLQQRYDMSRSLADKPFALFVWRVFPISMMALLAGMMAFSPKAQDPQYVMFLAVVTPFIPLYAQTAKGVPLWQNQSLLRFAGLAVAIAAIYLT